MRNEHARSKTSPKLKTPCAKMPSKKAEIPEKTVDMPEKKRRKYLGKRGRRQDSRTVQLKGLNICCSLFMNVMNLEGFRSVKVIGCEILTGETMSLQNDMWSALMEKTTWSVLGSGGGNSYKNFPHIRESSRANRTRAAFVLLAMDKAVRHHSGIFWSSRLKNQVPSGC